MRALGGADDPPCGEAMGRWQREALTEGLWRYRCGPSTIACGDGPLPHRYATGRIGGLARNPSELIRQPAAEKPLVGATDVRDDRRFGEARGDAAILRAADQREALAQVARQRIGARDPQRIFARGRLAPRAVIDGKTARGAAFGIDVVIIAAEALAIEIHRRRHAQIGALRQRAAVIDRRRRRPAAVAARNIL